MPSRRYNLVVSSLVLRCCQRLIITLLYAKQEEPSFPLVDREDSELTEEEVKEKRKQKLAKAGYDARMRLKAEKLAEKARLVSSSSN